jgi:hypothetical protein
MRSQAQKGSQKVTSKAPTRGKSQTQSQSGRSSGSGRGGSSASGSYRYTSLDDDMEEGGFDMYGGGDGGSGEISPIAAVGKRAVVSADDLFGEFEALPTSRRR